MEGDERGERRKDEAKGGINGDKKATGKEEKCIKDKGKDGVSE